MVDDFELCQTSAFSSGTGQASHSAVQAYKSAQVRFSSHSLPHLSSADARAHLTVRVPSISGSDVSVAVHRGHRDGVAVWRYGVRSGVPPGAPKAGRWQRRLHDGHLRGGNGGSGLGRVRHRTSRRLGQSYGSRRSRRIHLYYLFSVVLLGAFVICRWALSDCSRTHLRRKQLEPKNPMLKQRKPSSVIIQTPAISARDVFYRPLIAWCSRMSGVGDRPEKMIRVSMHFLTASPSDAMQMR